MADDQTNRARSPEQRARWAIEDRAWHAGRQAMSRCERRETCPHAEGIEREHWLRGWDDAAHEWG